MIQCPRHSASRTLDTMTTPEERLFPEFAARCNEARARLRAHMEERGLFERDGWKIYEFTRQANGGMELVMRPLHRTLTAPDGLECVVAIDEPGFSTSVECHT